METVLRPRTARLVGSIQDYAWGKSPDESLASLMYKRNIEAATGAANIPPFQKKTFGAEFWLGNHCNGVNYAVLEDGTSIPIEEFLRLGGGGVDGTQKAIQCDGGETTGPKTESTDAEDDDAKVPGPGGEPKPHSSSNLSYLLKVLAVESPLSIQVHPRKSLAEELHAIQPKIYKDAEEKTEIAISMSAPFKGLFGFRPVKDILLFMDAIPEFETIVNWDASDASPTAELSVKESLPSPKNGFTKQLSRQQSSISAPAQEEFLKRVLTNSLMMPDKMFRELIDSILNTDLITVENRYAQAKSGKKNGGVSATAKKFSHSVLVNLKLQSPNSNVSLDDMIEACTQLRANHQRFPYDRGIIAPIYLNLLKVKPGDCVVMNAGILHGYISGHCIECMANSDNVIRSGLTPKPKDVDAMLRAVTFNPTTPSQVMITPAAMSCTFEPASKTSRLLHYPCSAAGFGVYILLVAPGVTAKQMALSSECPVTMTCLIGRGQIAFGPSSPKTLPFTQGTAMIFNTEDIENMVVDTDGPLLLNEETGPKGNTNIISSILVDTKILGMDVNGYSVLIFATGREAAFLC